MRTRTLAAIRPFPWSLFLLAFLSLAIIGCGDKTYVETFDSLGSWGHGDNTDVTGEVANGVYEMYVKADSGLFWSTAGKEELGVGTYELETTQIEGPLDNGYGLMFRVDGEANDFLLFEISSDGFVWIGWCENGCEDEALPLVDEGWFESKAIREDLNVTNNLRVVYDDSEMVFSVNGQEVGRVPNSDVGDKVASGDVGLLVETLGQSGVRVAFDNFRYMPLAEEE